MAFTDFCECGGRVHSNKNMCVRCGAISPDVAIKNDIADKIKSNATDKIKIESRKSYDEYTSYRESTLGGAALGHGKRKNGSSNEYGGAPHFRFESRHDERRGIRDGATTEIVKKRSEGNVYSPISKQILCTSLLLFGLFVVYDLGKDYLRAESIRQAMKQRAEQLEQINFRKAEELKITRKEELERSVSGGFSPEVYKNITCKEWAEYHAKKRGFDYRSGYDFRKRNCTDKGYR